MTAAEKWKKTRNESRFPELEIAILLRMSGNDWRRVLWNALLLYRSNLLSRTNSYSTTTLRRPPGYGGQAKENETMDKKTGLEILEKMLGLMSEDGIVDVIHFAARTQKRDENPDTLKKRLIAAREQVEMLGAMAALLGGFAQKGNRCANTWLPRIRTDLMDWQTTLKRREAEWQTFLETMPDKSAATRSASSSFDNRRGE